jgi:transcriptional regulator with XRE-family HTH domain
MVTAKQGVQFSKRVGKAIARHRLEKGLTQDEVARAIGVEQETISRFERGATLPSLMRLMDIAELLEVPLDLLVQAGSSRAVDVAADLTAMLKKLTPQNREWVRDWTMQLCEKLAPKR